MSERLFDGEKEIYAEITDEDFVSRIESSQIFYKGDTLRCDVRTTQSHNLNSGNLRFSQ